MRKFIRGMALVLSVFLVVSFSGVALAEGRIPQIDCSTARIPITQAIYALLQGQGLEGPEPICSKTHGAWLNLAGGQADIIFLVAPTQEEFAAFAQAGVDIEMKIYGYDGLVFLGNELNPVANLTADQIRKIYSGKVKNWSNIPGGVDSDIVVYIRNDQSGSQRLFESLVWAGYDMPDFQSMKFKEGEIDPAVTHRTRSVTSYDGMEEITKSVLVNQYAIGYNIMSYVDSEFLRPAEEQRTVKATGNVQLRSGPGLDFAVVGSLSKGASLPYLGARATDQRGVDWYNAQHSSKGEVWVSSRYSALDSGASQNLKLFSIDGYAPTTHNFASGRYPFVTTSYVAIRADEPQDSPARQLFDWVGSEESRALIADNSTLMVAFSDPVVLVTAQRDPQSNPALAQAIEKLDRETLSRQDLYAFTQEEMGYLRQGVYALSGKRFPSGKYDDYFRQMAWYEAVGGSDAALAAGFTAQQAQNLALITGYMGELRRANANRDGQAALTLSQNSSNSKGEGALAVQLALAAQGYLEEKQCDGVFGSKSAAALKAYQQDNGLPATGVVDGDTRMWLVG